jgi:hypothetical protein
MTAQDTCSATWTLGTKSSFAEAEEKVEKSSSCTLQNIPEARLFVASRAVSRSRLKKASSNSVRLGENESRGNNERPHLDGRNNITSVEVSPTVLYSMVEGFPRNI